MKITLQIRPEDPSYPIMDGKTPFAEEFNRREEELYKTGNVNLWDFEQVTSVILEILVDDYNKKHSRKQKKHNDTN